MKPRFVREPTDEERQTLRRMKHREVGRVATRAHLVLLSARGYEVPEITDIHNVTDETVYKWIGRFDAEGPEGLHDRQREGRPPKIDEEAEEELRCVLAGPPTEKGYEMTRWTTPTLAEHLRRETGTDVHPETVRGALERLGFSWKRPRRQLPKDPDYEEHMAEVERAIEEAGPEVSVLFEDETELRRFPPLRKAWMRCGEQRSVEVPKQNGKFALYGALDIESGQVVTEPHEKGRSDYTKSFLARLLEEVEGEILLVWDRASWHTSNIVEEWIAQHDRLEVVLLPLARARGQPGGGPVAPAQKRDRGQSRTRSGRAERRLQRVL